MKKIILISFCFLISCASVPLSKNNLRYYLISGDKIRQSIDLYNDDIGCYPDSISKLIGNYISKGEIIIIKEDSNETTYYFSFFSSFKYSGKIWDYRLNKRKLNNDIEYEILLELSNPKNNIITNVEAPKRHKILFRSNGDYSDYNSIASFDKKGRNNILANYNNWVYIVSCNSRILNIECIEPNWTKLIQKYSTIFD